MHAEDVLLEGPVLDEAVAAVGTDVVLLASVGHAVVSECAPRGEFLVAKVARNGLLAVGLHVGPQGLVVLEPLGALEVNSIALLKSQQTFQQPFQQSFYSSVGHPVVLETLLKSLLKNLLRFQQSY